MDWFLYVRGLSNERVLKALDFIIMSFFIKNKCVNTVLTFVCVELYFYFLEERKLRYICWVSLIKLTLLTLSRRRPISYKNQSIDLQSIDWFGFYMISASVVKELSKTETISSELTCSSRHHFLYLEKKKCSKSLYIVSCTCFTWFPFCTYFTFFIIHRYFTRFFRL